MRRCHYCVLLLLFLMMGLSACANLSQPSEAESSQALQAEQLYRQGELEQAANAFLVLAERASGNQSAFYRLRAAEAQREAGNLDAVAQTLNDVKRRRLQNNELIRFDLLDAEIALNQGDALRAETVLVFPDAQLPSHLRVRALELRARAEMANGKAWEAARTRATLDHWVTGKDREQNRREGLDSLAVLSVDTLKTRAEALPGDDILRAWVAQALRKKGQALPHILPRLNQPVGTLPEQSAQNEQGEGYRSLQRVALLLPLSGSLASVANSIRDGFFAAYFADDSEQRPAVRLYDSGKTPQETVTAYKLAVADGADYVVGPLQRASVSELFHQPSPVRILALNHADSGEPPPPGSAEFGLLPDTEGTQAAEHMLERGIRNASVIAAEADWAERAALAFRAQFEAGGGHIVGEARLRDNEINYAAAIRQASVGLSKESNGGVFISMRPQQARLLMPQLKLAGVNAPAFATSHIYSGNLTPEQDRDLNGVEFCDAPWLFDRVPGRPDRSDLQQLMSVGGTGGRLFAFGMDAYMLLPYIDWMLEHPDTYLDGATGELAADQNGHIYRLLTWARFDNGVAHSIQGGLDAAPLQP